MKKILCLLFAIAPLLFSCGGSDKGPGKAAEEYYAMLIEGNYEGFVDGMYSAGHISDSYRKEKVVLMKHFMGRQKEINGGIVSAVATNDSIYPDGVHADVYLGMTYENQSVESVVVAMVKENDVWKMK